MPWSRNTLWRQGNILTRNDFEKVGLPETPDVALALAISHDCDIANEDLGMEPVVEFILANVIEQAVGNYKLGKNPRVLHLDVKHEGKPAFLKLIASRRVAVRKEELAAVQPSGAYAVNSSSIQVLQSWLAARYRRHALPNSLVDRLKTVFDYIEKNGKKNASGILSFRLSYEPEYELPPAEPYEIWLSIVYIEDQAEYKPMAKELADSLKNEFLHLIEKTRDYGHVDLRQCRAFSEFEFSLGDMRKTVEYHLEHLSYRTDPPGPTTEATPLDFKRTSENQPTVDNARQINDSSALLSCNDLLSKIWQWLRRGVS